MKDRVLLDYNLAAEFLSFLKVEIDTAPGEMNLLCLQGIAPDPDRKDTTLVLNDNAENVYNDTVAFVFKLEDGTPGVGVHLGTVDPGATSKDHAGGAAHLTFGQHLYVPGLHHGFPALRALNEKNRVWRDLAKTGAPAPGDPVQEGAFGVNVHAGGSRQVINDWSAGCLNICGGWTGEAYKELLYLTKIHAAHQKAIRVTVWSGRDLVRFSEVGWNMRPTLMLGILNPWVAELQALLAKKGFYKGPFDCDWREGTDEAVRSFQKASNLEVDGIVGPDTWGKLLA